MSSAETAQSVDIFDLRLLIFDLFLQLDPDHGAPNFKNLKSKIRLINLKDEGPALMRSL